MTIFLDANGAACSHLWTSDRRHFGTLYGKTVEGVRIVSSILLADLIEFPHDSK